MELFESLQMGIRVAVIGFIALVILQIIADIFQDGFWNGICKIFKACFDEEDLSKKKPLAECASKPDEEYENLLLKFREECK